MNRILNNMVLSRYNEFLYTTAVGSSSSTTVFDNTLIEKRKMDNSLQWSQKLGSLIDFGGFDSDPENQYLYFAVYSASN